MSTHCHSECEPRDRAGDVATDTATAAGPQVHPLALCESDLVGAGTRIWAFAHVMKNARIGEYCNICDHAFVESGAVIGDRVTIKNRAMIWDGVTLEDDVFIGPGAIFTNDLFPRSHRHPDAPPRPESEWLVRTRVRQNASIGAGAIIVCGHTIGRYATVGAGAVVTRDVPDHRLVVGNPAQVVGWVSVCGRPLDSKLRCLCCGRQYTVVDGALRTV